MEKVMRKRGVGAAVAAAALIGTLGFTAGLAGAQDGTTTTEQETSTTVGETTTTVEETSTTEETTPTTEAPVQGGSMTITNDVCNVTIVASVTGGGSYAVEVWDDGAMIDSLGFTADGAGDVTLSYTVEIQPGDDAPGLGFSLVSSEGQPFDGIDPYLVDRCGEPSSEGGSSEPNVPGRASGAGAVRANPSFTG